MNLKNMQLSVYYSTWQDVDKYIGDNNLPLPLNLNTGACSIDTCVLIIEMSISEPVKSIMRSVFE